MTTLAERAAAAAGRADAPPAPAAAPLDSAPQLLDDPSIPEPGPDGPEQIPVWAAWSRVMGTVRGIAKNGWYGKPGTQGSYQFRGVDAALNSFGPACRLHGVLVLPIRTDASYRDVKTSTGKNSRECTVTVTYRIIGPAGDDIEVQSVGESMDSADKGTAKALSTSLRSLLLLGGLVPVDGPDPDSANVERGEAPARTAEDYRDEQMDPKTTPSRLNQIRNELRALDMLNARVPNENNELETLDSIGGRMYRDRTGGGA